MSQSREDMRKKLDEARHHFARELHNDQVSIEREKLKRNRRLASGVAAQRQAWAEFEAVDWAARSKKMRLVRLAHPRRGRRPRLTRAAARFFAERHTVSRPAEPPVAGAQADGRGAEGGVPRGHAAVAPGQVLRAMGGVHRGGRQGPHRGAGGRNGAARGGVAGPERVNWLHCSVKEC